MAEYIRESFDGLQKGQIVEFFKGSVYNKSETKKKGCPQYDEVVKIKVKMAGSRDVLERPMKEEDKLKFPKHWEAFERNEEYRPEGIPIDDFTYLNSGQIDTLKKNGIKVVEQLADIPDQNLSRIGHFLDAKYKAQEWLKVRKDNASTLQLIEDKKELEARVKTLENQIELLKKPKVRKKKK